VYKPRLQERERTNYPCTHAHDSCEVVIRIKIDELRCASLGHTAYSVQYMEDCIGLNLVVLVVHVRVPSEVERCACCVRHITEPVHTKDLIR